MGRKSDLKIAQPLTLRCGLTLPNRLVKAAMAETLAGDNQLPDERLQAIYRQWADGGWGLIITGHVHVDDAHLGHPSDPAISPSQPAAAIQAAFGALARACRGTTNTSTRAIVQLNHPGRQSPRGAGTRGLFAPPVAPSAVPMSIGTGLIPWLLRPLFFPCPRALTRDEIAAVVSQFAAAARHCAEAGFDGVEIHAAHGYLLSQFLSPKTNLRTDEYGGDARGRARIVVEVVRAIREATDGLREGGFCVGIKLNSVDYQHEGEADERDVLEQVRAVADAGVDFVEVSGGTYEDFRMMWGNEGPEAQGPKSERTKAREAFFLEFAKVIRSEIPDVPLMVTGGFSSRGGMEKAVADGDCDLVGLGRPAIIHPTLPDSIIFNPELNDQDARIYRRKMNMPWFFKTIGMPGLGTGVDTQWYAAEMQKWQHLKEK